MDYVYSAGEMVSNAWTGALGYVWREDEKFDIVKLMRLTETCKTRMALLKSKKASHIKLERANCAQLLRENNNEAVRIKVEAIIHDEYLIEALTLMVPILEVLKARRYMIEQSTECSHDLMEPVTTITYAARYIEVEDFQEMRHQFELKYGKFFIEKATNDYDMTVNESVKFKLSLNKDPMLVLMYIRQIAEEFGIKLEQDEEPRPMQHIQPTPVYPQIPSAPDFHDHPEHTIEFQPIYYGEQIELKSPEEQVQNPQYTYPMQQEQVPQTNVLSDLERRLSNMKATTPAPQPQYEPDDDLDLMINDITSGDDIYNLDDDDEIVPPQHAPIVTLENSIDSVEEHKEHFDDLLNTYEPSATPLETAQMNPNVFEEPLQTLDVVHSNTYEEAATPLDTEYNNNLVEHAYTEPQYHTRYPQSLELDQLVDRATAIGSPEEAPYVEPVETKPSTNSFDDLLNRHMDDDDE